MTKAKPRETEVYHGAGASAKLVLIRKNGPGMYHNVQPSGRRFQAFVYKPEKKRSVGIGSFDTAIEAAVAAAVAEKSVKAGMPVYSPENPRFRKGAARTTAFAQPGLCTRMLARVLDRMPTPRYLLQNPFGSTHSKSVRCWPLLICPWRSQHHPAHTPALALLYCRDRSFAADVVSRVPH